MSSRIHPQARTTPKIRQEIKDSGLSSREAAKVFNITRATAQKWLGRDDVQDRSHRAHTLHTTLSQAQEAIVLALRQSLYLPLDDLLFITKQYINPAVSRAGIARLLKREGMSRLTDLIATAEGEKITPKKTFRDYEPGFIHIDIKYLPQMPDETSRRYLFVAIDRATRWVFMHIYSDMTEASSVDFLRRLKLASPIKISKILTDNGSQFTDRFATKDKKPSGNHAFDVACAALPAEHRLAPPRHPQTNGMVERFNGRINELLQQTRFDSRADLQATLLNYLKLYNHHIPQRAIGSKTPILALKEWQQKRPELFVKRVYDQTGLDTYSLSAVFFALLAKYDRRSDDAGCLRHRSCFPARHAGWRRIGANARRPTLIDWWVLKGVLPWLERFLSPERDRDSGPARRSAWPGRDIPSSPRPNPGPRSPHCATRPRP
jgi:transposase InsO family protein